MRKNRLVENISVFQNIEEKVVSIMVPCPQTIHARVYSALSTPSICAYLHLYSVPRTQTIPTVAHRFLHWAFHCLGGWDWLFECGWPRVMKNLHVCELDRCSSPNCLLDLSLNKAQHSQCNIPSFHILHCMTWKWTHTQCLPSID